MGTTAQPAPNEQAKDRGEMGLYHRDLMGTTAQPAPNEQAKDRGEMGLYHRDLV
jgi:hypothetical protein